MFDNFVLISVAIGGIAAITYFLYRQVLISITGRSIIENWTEFLFSK